MIQNRAKKNENRAVLHKRRRRGGLFTTGLRGRASCHRFGHHNKVLVERLNIREHTLPVGLITHENHVVDFQQRRAAVVSVKTHEFVGASTIARTHSAALKAISKFLLRSLGLSDS